VFGRVGRLKTDGQLVGARAAPIKLELLSLVASKNNSGIFENLFRSQALKNNIAMV